MKKILLFITLISFVITQAQIVNIPDTNFKNALLNHNPIIDINNDNEIQISEANVFNGVLVIEFANISDLTGIEEFTNIIKLFCFNNQITNLDLSNNTYLTELSCDSNQITNLNLSNNINLTQLSCDDNQITNLDLSNNINLTQLGCTFNYITNLNLSNNINLTQLSCSDNGITNLDLSNNINLTGLSCSDNGITNLDLSNNINLTGLGCSNNQITNLDLSNNINLTDLNCAFNQITNLNLSSNQFLVIFSCNNMPTLEYLNIKNGNNTNMNIFVNNTPSLSNICIDDINNSDFIDDILASAGHSIDFTENCTLSTNENTLLDFSVYPTPTENILNIKSKTEIIKIEIYSKLGQKIKETSENKINISNLMQGLYFLKVEDINGNFGVKKIVKK